MGLYRDDPALPASSQSRPGFRQATGEQEKWAAAELAAGALSQSGRACRMRSAPQAYARKTIKSASWFIAGQPLQAGFPNDSA